MAKDTERDADTLDAKPGAKGAARATVPGRPESHLPSPLEAATPRFSPGDMIDHFRVVDKLGEGGMGVVLKAYDPELDRHLAIKILRPAFFLATGSSSEARDRLRREAQAMAKIRDPNVITVYSVGTIGEQIYIAMEYVDAGTLHQWSRKKRDWRDTVDRYIKAGRGLSAAHRAGLVHRDFKPANVLLDSEGRVLVTDFGLVSSDAGSEVVPPRNTNERPATKPISVSLTETGAILGTPPYMAPEQHAGDPADARADQFAFCVSLHEGLYGQRPHAGEDYAAVAGNILHGDIRDAPSDTEVPGWLREILLRGLSVRPGDRYENMDALLQVLESPPKEERPLWRGRMGSAAVAALAVGLGATWLWPDSEPVPTNATPPITQALPANALPTSDAAAALDATIAPDAEATLAGELFLVESSPAQVELYRADDGAYFGATPFVGIRQSKYETCEVKLIGKRSGYLDSTPLWCDERRIYINLYKDRAAKSDPDAPIRDAEPCQKERLILDEARANREVDAVSEAWSLLSQCFAESDRMEASRLAFQKVTEVLDKPWLSAEAKRQKWTQEGRLAFRLAKGHWLQGYRDKAVDQARLALKRLADSDRFPEQGEVYAWLDEQKLLQDLRVEVQGVPPGLELLHYVVFPGVVKLTAFGERSFHETHPLSIERAVGGEGEEFTHTTFERLLKDEYTICVEALHYESVAFAFGCQTFQHGPQGSAAVVIQLQNL